jgi:murein L,D-transpeptidase YafK
LGLALACAASLCLGAFLSYQAAMHEEAAQPPVAAAFDTAPADKVAALDAQPAAKSVETGAPSGQSAANPAPAAASAAVPASAGTRLTVLASLESDSPPIFSPSNPLAAPLDLRIGREADPIEAALQQSDLDGLAGPPAVSAAPETPAEALFHGKPAPLPPVRPSSLSAAMAPPQAAPDALSAGPFPPPVTASSAPPPVPSSGSQPPLASAPAPAAPQAKAPPLAATVAATPSQPGSFPGIANALAAVTNSVGGANAAVTPGQPPAPAELEASGGASGFKKGMPVYVRIFKTEGVLELWLKRGANYALYKSYPVCKWSGQLGPKTRQADYQSPEGFYSVSARQLNPNSHYHLAFDIGYPNAYDRRHGSTGSAVMVHGDCKSVGCFAMTNNGIDEIYGIVEAALRAGQHEVPVHIFPFRMSDDAIARESSPKAFMAFIASTNPSPQRDWSAFWRNLKEGYDMFERSHVPPVAYACGDRYDFGAAASSCSRIAGW